MRTAVNAVLPNAQQVRDRAWLDRLRSSELERASRLAARVKGGGIDAPIGGRS